MDCDKVNNLQFSLHSGESSAKKQRRETFNQNEYYNSKQLMSPVYSDNEIESQLPQMKNLLMDGCSPTSCEKKVICESFLERSCNDNHGDLSTLRSNLLTKFASPNEAELSSRNKKKAIIGQYTSLNPIRSQMDIMNNSSPILSSLNHESTVNKGNLHVKNNSKSRKKWFDA